MGWIDIGGEKATKAPCTMLLLLLLLFCSVECVCSQHPMKVPNWFAARFPTKVRIILLYFPASAVLNIETYIMSLYVCCFLSAHWVC